MVTVTSELDIGLPTPLVTSQRYAPESAVAEMVSGDMVPPVATLEPPLFHWMVAPVGLPSVTVQVRETEVPSE